jgi:AcrR family transcriptional regulator
MSATADPAAARDRLLLAGAQLLEEAEGGEVSTRAICERAGVQAPTLYHHFGSKQGLLEAVVSHGLRQFLARRRAEATGPRDPIADLREGWDDHIRFGLENPNFSALIYGRVIPGRPCGVVADVEAMILETLRPAAREGRLRVAPEQAAAQIVAASSGVVMALITQPAGEVDLALSDAVRDAVLARITVTPGPDDAQRTEPSVPAAAIALAAALDDDPAALSAGETVLLREWLARLATP